MNDRTVKVGVGVMILKDNKVLLGERVGSKTGNDHHAFTGGHLEFGESFEDCAIRETREEAGIEITNVRFHHLANMIYKDMQYVHIGILADWKSGNPTALEPHKCKSWRWYSLTNLPKPIMKASSLQLEYYKTNRPYIGTIKVVE